MYNNRRERTRAQAFFEATTKAHAVVEAQTLFEHCLRAFFLVMRQLFIAEHKKVAHKTLLNQIFDTRYSKNDVNQRFVTVFYNGVAKNSACRRFFCVRTCFFTSEHKKTAPRRHFCHFFDA